MDAAWSVIVPGDELSDWMGDRIGWAIVPVQP